MDSSDDTPEPTSKYAKSAKGRKPTNTLPQNKKQLLNRVNGRNFRERKQKEREEMQERIEHLQRQVREFEELLDVKAAENAKLSARLVTVEREAAETVRSIQSTVRAAGFGGSGISSDITVSAAVIPETTEPSVCTNCAEAKARVDFYLNRMIDMTAKMEAAKAQVSQMQKTIDSLETARGFNPLVHFDFVFNNETSSANQNTPHHSTRPNTSTNSPEMKTPDSMIVDDWTDIASQELPPLSAEAMFGPVRVEYVRYSLKRIPSLVHSKHVDLVADLVVHAARSTEKRQISRHLLRAISSWHEVWHSCKSFAEQYTAFEIFQSFQELNLPIMEYLMNRVVDFKIIEKKQTAPVIPERGLELNQYLKSIPSLKDSHDSIDEYCALLCLTKMHAEDFVLLGRTIRALLKKCSTEDRALLFAGNRQFREKNRHIAVNYESWICLSFRSPSLESDAFPPGEDNQ
ncbi:hypothetical protein BJ741DRAFT_601870 [Chytriomyces cf. hyalinus JEL632]|nr:hypothetical protein BJ741DRAFT_601870 [Chytriomyces cf. hyalinus JEL632]